MGGVPGVGDGVPAGGAEGAEESSGSGSVTNYAGPTAASVEGKDWDSLTYHTREHVLIDRLVAMADAAHEWMIFLAANGGLTPEDVEEMLNDFEAIANDPNATAKEKEAARQIVNALKEILATPEKGGAQDLVYMLSDPATYLANAAETAKNSYKNNDQARTDELLRLFNERMGGGGTEVTSDNEVLSYGDDRVVVEKDGQKYVIVSNGDGTVDIYKVEETAYNSGEAVYYYETVGDLVEHFSFDETNHEVLRSQSNLQSRIVSSDLRSAGLPPDFDLNNVPPRIQGTMMKYQDRMLLERVPSTTHGGGFYYQINQDRLAAIQNEMLNRCTAVTMMAGIIQQTKDMFYDVWIVMVDSDAKKPSGSFADVTGRLMKTWTRMFQSMVSRMDGYKNRINNATLSRKLEAAKDEAQDQAEDGDWGWLRQVGDAFGGSYVDTAAAPIYLRMKTAIDQERTDMANRDMANIKKILYQVSGDLDTLGDPLSSRARDQMDRLLEDDMGGLIEDRSGTQTFEIFGLTIEAGGNSGFIGADEDKIIDIMDKMKNINFARDFVEFMRLKAQEIFQDVLRSMLEMPKKRSNLEKVMELMKNRQNMASEWVSKYVEALQEYCSYYNMVVDDKIELKKAEERAEQAGWALFTSFITGGIVGGILFSGLWYKIFLGDIEGELSNYDNFYKEGGLDISVTGVPKPEGMEASEEARVNRLEKIISYYLMKLNAGSNPSLITSQAQGFSGIDQEQIAAYNLTIENITMALNLIAQLHESMSTIRHKVWSDNFQTEIDSFSQKGQLTSYMQEVGNIVKLKTGMQIQATNEKVQELNKQRAEAIKAEQAENAILTAFMDLIGGILAIVGAICACIPCAVTQAVGAALVVVGALICVASAAIKYVQAKDNFNAADTITISSDRDLVKVNKLQSQSEAVEASENERVSRSYERLYMQMLMQINGMNSTNMRASAGDGYFALDIGAITEVGKSLAHMSMAQAIISNIEIARNSMQEGVWENVFDLEPGSKSGRDVVKGIVMRNFSTVMDLLKARMGQIGTEIEAMNRLEQADKMLESAKIALIVACVTAAIKIVASFCGPVLSAVLSIVSAVVEFAVNIALAVEQANANKGELNEVRNKALASMDSAFDTESDPMMEYIKDCLKQINSGIIQSTAGGKVTIDKSNVMKAKNTIEKIFQNREMIQELREAAQQIYIQTFASANGFSSVMTDQSMVSMADQALKQLALNSVDNLEKNVQSEVERINQINEARRNMYLTIVTQSINLAASVASSGASIKVSGAIQIAGIVAKFLGEMITNAVFNSTRDEYKATESSVGKSSNSATDLESQAVAAERADAKQAVATQTAQDEWALRMRYGQSVASFCQSLMMAVVTLVIKNHVYGQNATAIKSNEREVDNRTSQNVGLTEAANAAKEGDTPKLMKIIQEAEQRKSELEKQKAELEKQGKDTTEIDKQIETLGKTIDQMKSLIPLSDKIAELKTAEKEKAQVESELGNLKGEREAEGNKAQVFARIRERIQAEQAASGTDNLSMAAKEAIIQWLQDAGLPKDSLPSLPTATASGLLAEVKQLQAQSQAECARLDIEIAFQGKRLVAINAEIKILEAEKKSLEKTVLKPVETQIETNVAEIKRLQQENIDAVIAAKANNYAKLTESKGHLRGIITNADLTPEQMTAQLTEFFDGLPDAYKADTEIMQQYTSALNGGLAKADVDNKMPAPKLAAMTKWLAEQQIKPDGKARSGHNLGTQTLNSTVMSIVVDKMKKGDVKYARDFVDNIETSTQGPAGEALRPIIIGNLTAPLNQEGATTSKESVLMEMLIQAKLDPENAPMKSDQIEIELERYEKSNQALNDASKPTPKQEATIRDLLNIFDTLMADAKKDTGTDIMATLGGPDKIAEIEAQIKELRTAIADKKDSKEIFEKLQKVEESLAQALQSGQGTGDTNPLLQTSLINTIAAGYVLIINSNNDQSLLDKATKGLIDLGNVKVDVGDGTEGRQSNELSRVLFDVKKQNPALFKKIEGLLTQMQGGSSVLGKLLSDMAPDLALSLLGDLLKSSNAEDQKRAKAYLKGIAELAKSGTTPIQKGTFARLLADVAKQLDMEDSDEAGLLLDTLKDPENLDLTKGVALILTKEEKTDKLKQILDSLPPKERAEVLGSTLSYMEEKKAVALVKELYGTDKDYAAAVVAASNNSNLAKAVVKEIPVMGILLKEKGADVITDPAKATLADIQKAKPEYALQLIFGIARLEGGEARIREILMGLDGKSIAGMLNTGNLISQAVVIPYISKYNPEDQMAIVKKVFDADKKAAAILCIGLEKPAQAQLIAGIPGLKEEVDKLSIKKTDEAEDEVDTGTPDALPVQDEIPVGPVDTRTVGVPEADESMPQSPVLISILSEKGKFDTVLTPQEPLDPSSDRAKLIQILVEANGQVEAGGDEPKPTVEDLVKFYMKLNPEQRDKFRAFLRSQDMLNLSITLISAVGSQAYVTTGLARKGVSGGADALDFQRSLASLDADVADQTPTILERHTGPRST